LTNIWIAGVVPILEGFESGDGTVVAREPSVAAANNDNGKAEPENVRRKY